MRLPRRVSVWTGLAAAAIAAGVALRIWIFTSPLSALESDEAVVGLMALRALGGDLTVFYWGALYGGSQEALLTAVAFAAWGPSTFLLKAVAVVLYAVAGVLVWLVGRRTVSEPAARVGAAIFWLWPPFLVWWSTKARAYFASGLVLGLAALLLVLRLRERDSRFDAAMLGLVLGVGVWATLQSMLLSLPALAWLAWRRPRAYRLAGYALPTATLGAAPWLAWNVRHGGNAIVPRSVAGAETSFVERLADLFTIVLPTWLGLRAPYTHDWLLGRALGIAALLLTLAALALLLVRRPRGLEPLLVIATAFPFLYAASSFTFLVAEPRYLVFVAPVIALLIGAAVVRGGPALAASALVVAGAISVAGLVQLERQGRYAPLRVPADIGPVLDTLDRHRVDRVLANYWIAYRITFESDERIIASPTGFWRYRPYHDAVRADPMPGRVFLATSANERRARAALLRRGYARLPADGFVVYVPNVEQ